MSTALHRPDADRPARSAGFTLIELLIVVAITSIATAFAVPAFLSTIRANRLDAATAELRAALQLARSEAVKRATVVVVEPIAAGDWTGGLRVYVDTDRDLTTAYSSARDTVVRENALRRTGLTTGPSAPARLGFDAKGANVTLGAAAGAQTPTTSTIRLCASTQGRQIGINNGGLVGSVDASC